MLSYLFHHDEFCGHLDDKNISNIRRVDLQTLSIDIDKPIDNRGTWAFKGLSASTVSKLLHVISSHCSHITFKTSLSENDIRELTVPYDDMLFSVNEEELHVVYSISNINESSLRRCIMGPHNIHLYEKEIPHFGPIIVYKSTQREEERGDEGVLIIHQMQDIVSSPTDIVKALSSLNFG